MQEDLWVPKLARTAGHPSKGLYLEKRKRDISHVLFLDHLFLQWIPVHQFLCGVPTKNISVEDCKSAINVHTARNMIEAVESPTVNEGKVSENGLVSLRLTISTHSTLSFPINGKWEEDASMNKITSSSSHRTLILLDVFFPPKIFSFKGCLFSISWMQYHSWQCITYRQNVEKWIVS